MDTNEKLMVNVHPDCIGIIFPEITAVGISPPTTGIEPRIQIDLSGTEDRTEYHQLENVELISLRVYHRNNGFSRIKITSKNTKLVGISIENGDNMYIYIYTLSGWWLTYPSEKYEFVNEKDHIPYSI